MMVVTNLNNLLQAFPRLFQGFHCKPSVPNEKKLQNVTWNVSWDFNTDGYLRTTATVGFKIKEYIRIDGHVIALDLFVQSS